MQPQATSVAEAVVPQEGPSHDSAAAADAAAVRCNNGGGGGVSAAATPRSAPAQPQPVQATQCVPKKRKAPAAATAAATAPAQQKRNPPPQHAPAVHLDLPLDMADFKHPPRMSKAGLLKLFDGDFFWQYTPHDVELCPEGVDTCSMTVPANTGVQVQRNGNRHGHKNLNQP